MSMCICCLPVRFLMRWYLHGVKIKVAAYRRGCADGIIASPVKKRNKARLYDQQVFTALAKNVASSSLFQHQGSCRHVVLTLAALRTGCAALYALHINTSCTTTAPSPSSLHSLTATSCATKLCMSHTLRIHCVITGLPDRVGGRYADWSPCCGCCVCCCS